MLQRGPRDPVIQPEIKVFFAGFFHSDFNDKHLLKNMPRKSCWENKMKKCKCPLLLRCQFEQRMRAKLLSLWICYRFFTKKNSTVHYLHRLVGYFHDRQRKTKYPFKRSLTALTLDNSTKWYPLLYKRIFSFELEKNNSMSKMKLAQSGSRQAKSTTEEAAIALVWMAFQQSAIFQQSVTIVFALFFQKNDLFSSI